MSLSFVLAGLNLGLGCEPALLRFRVAGSSRSRLLPCSSEVPAESAGTSVLVSTQQGLFSSDAWGPCNDAKSLRRAWVKVERELTIEPLPKRPCGAAHPF